MKINNNIHLIKQIATIYGTMFASFAICACLDRCLKPIEKENKLKTEIMQKDPARYVRVSKKLIQNTSIWEKEYKKMEDSLKLDSLSKTTYFHGMQRINERKNNGFQIKN